MTNVDTSEESQTILSLCTGIRGLERGIERAMGNPCNVAAYVEIEAFIIENLLAGMEAGVLAPTPIWSNLKTFPWSEFRGKIHGIIGGYPCQPFSVAGNQLGEEDPRHLWPYIKEGIRAIGPFWCFFENVPGHLNIGYETVRRELQELGYRVEEGIFSAEEVGAPHKRERLFILAILANTTSQGFPLSGFSAERKLSKKEGKGIFDRFKQSGNELENPCRIIWRLSGKWNQDIEIARSGKRDLAYAKCERFQGYRWYTRKSPQSQFGDCGFPARPGQDQYDFEEPRTTKSGMGITINGYNFREDLLRAAGNGVAEQTTELAWNILWEKHSKNL